MVMPVYIYVTEFEIYGRRSNILQMDRFEQAFFGKKMKRRNWRVGRANTNQLNLASGDLEIFQHQARQFAAISVTSIDRKLCRFP